MSRLPVQSVALLLSLVLVLCEAGRLCAQTPPDLTAGGVPTTTININLGPTGLRGWVYHVKADTTASRQIQVQVVEALREATSTSESIDLWPIGAQWPVTVHGVRRSFTGTVTVATLTGAEASRMLDGLRRSPVVLLQPPGGRAQAYYSVGDVRRLSPPNIASPERVWQLDVVHREAPVVEWSYPAAATWQDYVTNSRTWRHWLGGTWLDVLAGGV